MTPGFSLLFILLPAVLASWSTLATARTFCCALDLPVSEEVAPTAYMPSGDKNA